MDIKYLGENLSYLVGKVKALIPTKTSDLTNDSGFVTSASDTKNTAGIDSSASQMYLVGSTTSPTTSSDGTARTYANLNVYATNGKLHASKLEIGTGSATGNYAVVEGRASLAIGDMSHAEGGASEALGERAHAEGNSSHSCGDWAHAEAYQTAAIGEGSHSEGGHSYALGAYSHAEGMATYAEGRASHAEGGLDWDNEHAINISSARNISFNFSNKTITFDTTSNQIADKKIILIELKWGPSSYNNDYYSVSNIESRRVLDRITNDAYFQNIVTVCDKTPEFYHTSDILGITLYRAGNLALGKNSHVEGYETIATNESEHAQGLYNVSHASDTVPASATLHSIGIGSSSTRSNAVEVMGNGDVYINGIGDYDGVHIKGETGAPANLRTLQEVIEGSYISANTSPVNISANTKYYYIYGAFNIELNLALLASSPNNLSKPREVIVMVKNTDSSSDITLTFPAAVTNGTVHNMIGLSNFTIGAGKVAELVFTFWPSNDVTFNGGVE